MNDDRHEGRPTTMEQLILWPDFPTGMSSMRLSKGLKINTKNPENSSQNYRALENTVIKETLRLLNRQSPHWRIAQHTTVISQGRLNAIPPGT